MLLKLHEIQVLAPKLPDALFLPPSIPSKIGLKMTWVAALGDAVAFFRKCPDTLVGLRHGTVRLLLRFICDLRKHGERVSTRGISHS